MVHIINKNRIYDIWMIHLPYKDIVEKLLKLNFNELGTEYSRDGMTDLSYVKNYNNKTLTIILEEWHAGYCSKILITNTITNETHLQKFEHYPQLFEYLKFESRKEKIYKLLNP